MFFVLSKILSFLIRPLTLVTGLLVLSWLIRKPIWKKRLFVGGICLLLFFSNEFIANEVMMAWEIPVTRFADLPRKYTYGVLLCGAAKTEAGPPDRVYIGSAADRINHTVQLYKLGHIQKILISGGSGRVFDVGEREADQLSSLIQIMGVPIGDIIVENESRNTNESAEQVKKILENVTTPDQCLMITSAYHMRRSIGCFRKAGWPMTPFSVDFQTHKRQFTPDVFLIPKQEALGAWAILLKEWSGYAVYWMMGYI